MGYYRDLIDDLLCDITFLKSTIKRNSVEKAKKTRKLNRIKKIIDWLESHNKNYTKEQYNKILEIKDILE